jgi:hypothetical protein
VRSAAEIPVFGVVMPHAARSYSWMALARPSLSATPRRRHSLLSSPNRIGNPGGRGSVRAAFFRLGRSLALPTISKKLGPLRRSAQSGWEQAQPAQARSVRPVGPSRSVGRRAIAELPAEKHPTRNPELKESTFAANSLVFLADIVQDDHRSGLAQIRIHGRRRWYYGRRPWYLGRPSSGPFPCGSPPLGRGCQSSPCDSPAPGNGFFDWLIGSAIRPLGFFHGETELIPIRGGRTPDRSELFGSHGQRPWNQKVMKYETQTISQRSDRRTVGPDRAFAAFGQPTTSARSAAQDRAARDRQRPVLPYPRRVYLAGAATRLPPMEDHLQLLPMVGRGRDVATTPGCSPPDGPRPGQTGADAWRRRHRQPFGQDRPRRQGAGHRRWQEAQRLQAVSPRRFPGVLITLVVTATNGDDVRAARDSFATVRDRTFHDRRSSSSTASTATKSDISGAERGRRVTRRSRMKPWSSSRPSSPAPKATANREVTHSALPVCDASQMTRVGIMEQTLSLPSYFF